MLHTNQAGRQRHNPVTGHVPFGITAVVGDANVKTGRDNLITGLEARVGAVGHHTTKIDTSDARKTANDLAGAGRGQCIL